MRERLAEHESRFAALAAQAQAALSLASEEVTKFQREGARRAEDELDRRVAEESSRAEAIFAQALDRASADAAAVTRTAAGAEWRSPTAWKWVDEADPRPRETRVGTATFASPGNSSPAARLPVLVPLLDQGHLVVRGTERNREQAIGVVGAALLRILATRPIGQVRFRIFDPVGTGATLSAFGAFDLELVARGLPISERDDLRDTLRGLNNHATSVSSQFLRGEYDTVGDFITATEPGLLGYEVLVLLDLPRGVDRDIAERLESLAANSAKRGISILAHLAADNHGDVPISATTFGPSATVVENAGDRWTLSSVPGLEFELDPPPPLQLIQSVASRPPPQRHVLEFEDTLTPGTRYRGSSGDGLEVEIGREGRGKVTVRLDDEAVHGLVAGDTGSGKSNLLRVLIYGLAHQYSPDELEMYLLDFKEGVEFREFAATPGDMTYLPHARVVSVNSSRAFGVAVLEHLAELTAHRYASLPEGVRKISALRAQNPEQAFPRIVLVIDEFQVLFGTSDRLTERAVGALARLASQGRAAGVHFLLSTQSISDVGSGTHAGAQLDPVYKNARLRIGMRLSDAESMALLRMGNTAAGEITQRGVAVVNHDGGAESGNHITQIAYLDDDVARRERKEASASPVARRLPPRVFDGAKGADPAMNRELRRKSSSRRGAWAGASLDVDESDPRSQRAIFIQLMDDPNSNVAVIGAGQRSAVSALQWLTVGFAHSSAADGPIKLFVVDAIREDEGTPNGAVTATVRAARATGASVEILGRDAPDWIGRVAGEMLEGAPLPKAVVLFGADRIRGLDQALEGDADAFDPVTAGTLLSRIAGEAPIRDGHLLGWWSSYDSFTSVMRSESTIGSRIYLRMSEQQLQYLAPGQVDGPPEYPLAFWHDYAAGDSPELFQLYEPFGEDDIPEFLLR